MLRAWLDDLHFLLDEFGSVYKGDGKCGIYEGKDDRTHNGVRGYSTKGFSL